MPKRALRTQMLARRRSLSAADRDVASSVIQERLLTRPEFSRARVVALYAPLHNEVATDGLFRAARLAGTTVLYPAVVGDGLEFRQVDEAEQLRPGAYGIPEPGPDCPAWDPGGAELVVVPGIAFDLAGHRVGYGKGYYDKALHRLEGQGRLVGLCYDFQLVAELPGEPHDVQMDLVITEERVVHP
jgi:5-formyltetrahydrofolate cyclo-ligase